ncbi:hypothetical protein ES702_03176 [subsurface metagenome]
MHAHEGVASSAWVGRPMAITDMSYLRNPSAPGIDFSGYCLSNGVRQPLTCLESSLAYIDDQACRARSSLGQYRGLWTRLLGRLRHTGMYG